MFKLKKGLAWDELSGWVLILIVMLVVIIIIASNAGILDISPLKKLD